MTTYHEYPGKFRMKTRFGFNIPTFVSFIAGIIAYVMLVNHNSEEISKVASFLVSLGFFKFMEITIFNILIVYESITGRISRSEKIETYKSY